MQKVFHKIRKKDMDMDLVVKVLNGSCSVVPCPKVWNMQRIT